MNEQTISPNDIELPHPPFPAGPGHILRQAREACRLSQQDIANKLYIAVQRIQEIEVNDYSQMRAVIYAQGYLRAYAELVKVPVNSVLESFKSIEWAQQEGRLRKGSSDKWLRNALPLGGNREPRRGLNHLWLYMSVALLSLAIGFFGWTYWADKLLNETSPTEILQNEPVPTEEAIAMPSLADEPAPPLAAPEENPFVRHLSQTTPSNKALADKALETAPTAPTIVSAPASEGVQ